MTGAGALTDGRPERVAVVIPAKNEAERLEATIRAARSIDRVDMVVVVDDGSTDATSAVAKGADASVVRHRTNRGKAAAMATGADLVAMRDHADRASGEASRASTAQELLTEPRVPGHTGPLPVIDPAGALPRALLFLDADMGETATGAAPLVRAVLDDGVDMAIALLPPQEGAGGMGIVVGTARRGIARATGWEPEQPLSGTRCMTREAWDACQPLAGGWGVETSLTIDALTGGFWVKEIPCDLRHRATGNDMKGRLHRAGQLRDVVRALARRRTVRPPEEPDEAEGVEESEQADQVTETAGTAVAAPSAAPAPSDEPTPAPERVAAAALDPVELLPLDGELEPEDRAALADVDLEEFTAKLRALPAQGRYQSDELALLAGVDLDALAQRLRIAPVTGRFETAHVVTVASHLDTPPPPIPDEVDLPMDPADWAMLVAHAAVDAGNEER